jgi:hypothetical protein
MAKDKVYTFDRQSMRRISAAVQKSEGVKERKGNEWYPFKGGGGGAALQIGKTSAEWTKGTSQEVNLYSNADRTQVFEADGVTPKTSSVYNLFADVGDDKWVAFISGYLIAAECLDEEESGGG